MKRKKRNVSLSIVFAGIILCIAAVLAFNLIPEKSDAPAYLTDGNENDAKMTDSKTNTPEEPSFSLTWNTYGISSYDSSSGKLVKSTDATNKEDYVTTLHLSDEQKERIWELIKDLDIETYPDKYNPHRKGVSMPYMTLILSVNGNGINKTVTVEETVLSYKTDNAKGQKFLDVCKGIEDIITETDEWKNLPEYEFFYD